MIGAFKLIAEIGSLGAGRIAMTLGLLAAAGATLAVTATGAIFTDTSALASNAFSTGTVDIAASPASAVVSFTGMAPGDMVTAPITVSNNGSLQQRYSLVSVTSEDTLAAQLQMTVKTGVTDCSNSGFSADGTVLYGAGSLGSTAGTNVIGDPATGQQTGDRTLAAASSETLCVQVSLPSSTGNSYQNLTTSATFNFYAEQTVNNS